MTVLSKETHNELVMTRVLEMELYFKNHLNEFLDQAWKCEPKLPSKQGKNNPVGRVPNCFFQFKNVFNDFATSRLIANYNNQTVLSKSQSKLWKGLNDYEKQPFFDLYKKAHDIFMGLHPNYKYQPRRDKSILKVRSMYDKVKKQTPKKQKLATPAIITSNFDQQNQNQYNSPNLGYFSRDPASHIAVINQNCSDTEWIFRELFDMVPFYVDQIHF